MAKERKIEDYEARDAMHTLLRAGKITKDKPLLEAARKHAAEHAKEMAEVAERAGQLARRGMISDKQMARLKGGKSNQRANAKALDKTAPLASGNEGY